VRRLAVSVGDPNGVGPEIVLKAWASCRYQTDWRITVFGPRRALELAAQSCGLNDVLDDLDWRSAGPVDDHHLRPGVINAAAGASAVASATAAIEACRAGEFSAVVAGPHHETAIHQAGISFSGYPSLVARVCGLEEHSVFMMLVGGGLRIVHATLHESVATALTRLTVDHIVNASLAGVRACQAMGIERPRFALFGINPHASEGALFGPEDSLMTAPAARALREMGWPVPDPQGADVLLADHHVKPYDLYVAMLHDQGHIPIKLLAPQAASAISIGPDVLLASTGHGSAMDIAGSGKARADALIRSLKLMAGVQSTGVHSG